MYYTSKRIADKLWTYTAAVSAKSSRATRVMVVGLVCWLLVSLLLYLADEGRGMLSVYVSLLLLQGFLLYNFFLYRLLPRLRSKGKRFGGFMLRVFGLLLLSWPVLFGICMLLTQGRDPDGCAGFAFLTSLFQLAVTAPLSWALYQRQVRRNQEIVGLETELGQTSANLDFLRSQINPHFLFNALNTLYGMALQENSERTAEGIQRLGDMMRFMLHENQQPRILLAREIDYLRNYIELQSLRLVSSPGITLEAHIEDVPDACWIAPMLLIPFVENAFKHGISFQQKSWIKVSLHYASGQLFFDLYNSTHPRPEHDRLAGTSGVGLANVKQRLALLYPNKHELLIRQTQGEYFVHLTLDL
jgi:two-component system LytT family sensor kinase